MKTKKMKWKELEKVAMHGKGEMEISGVSLMCHLGAKEIISRHVILSRG